MGIEKKTYSFRLDEELAEKIRSYARMENRNFSNMIETILLQYVSNREGEDKK
mgnify:CR=1 FL=1